MQNGGWIGLTDDDHSVRNRVGLSQRSYRGQQQNTIHVQRCPSPCYFSHAIRSWLRRCYIHVLLSQDVQDQCPGGPGCGGTISTTEGEFVFTDGTVVGRMSMPDRTWTPEAGVQHTSRADLPVCGCLCYGPGALLCALSHPIMMSSAVKKAAACLCACRLAFHRRLPQLVTRRAQ